MAISDMKNLSSLLEAKNQDVMIIPNEKMKNLCTQLEVTFFTKAQEISRQ